MEEAQKAKAAAEALFAGGGVSENMPTTVVADAVGRSLLEVLVDVKLIPSKSEGRRIVQQNGLAVNDVKITDPNAVITEDMFTENGMIVKKGKKAFHRVKLS